MVESCSIADCGSRPFCRGWCSKHYARWQRHGDPLITTRQPPAPADTSEAWCPKCQRFRHISLFGRRSSRPDARRKGYCRECEPAYLAERLATDPAARAARRKAAREHNRSDRHRDKLLLRLYGIDLADYAVMLAAQGGCCAICPATKPGGNSSNWHVDHDHSTGRVRGLLCVRCNLGLGYFQDNPDFLDRASAYLRAS